MVEFDVPLTDEDIDTSDPMGSLMSMVAVLGGLMVLFFLRPIAEDLAQALSDMVAQLTGTNVGDGDAGGLAFGGD